MASCPMLRCGGFLPRLSSAGLASCPMLQHFGAAVASLAFVVECIVCEWQGLEDVEVSEMLSKMLLLEDECR